MDTSFLKRAKSKKIHNLDKEEIAEEDYYDDDEKDDNDDEDKDVDDYDHHSDSDIASDSNNNWNSNWNSNKDSEENYLGLKRLTEFLIDYHQNDSISNKKLCRSHNIRGVL